MGSFVDRDLRGFAIPDVRFSPERVNRSESGAAEARPRGGGVAAPDSPTARLAIVTTGDQDEDLVYQVEQGGHVVLGSGVRYSYRPSNEAATTRRGWEAPNQLMGWTAADYGTTPNTYLCACALGNGDILVAYAAGSTTAYFQTYAYDTDTWSGTIAFPRTVHGTGSIALATLPEGNVLAIFRDNATADWRVYRYSVIDAVSGGSWVLHGTHVLSHVPTSVATRSRLLVTPAGDMAYFYGWSGNLWQYASNSHGTRFTRVLQGTPPAGTAFDACVTASGKILVVVDGGSSRPVSYTVGSPYTPYTSVTGVTIDASNAVITDFWLVPDPTGRIYLYGRVGTTDALWMYYTDDEGASWTAVAYKPLDDGDANTYISYGQAVFAGGSVWIAHQFVDPTATQDPSICLMQLGGFSSVTVSNSEADAGRIAPGGGTAVVGGYIVPIALPENLTKWTKTGAGTTTLTGGRVQIATVANTDYYSPAAPASTDATAYCHWRGIVSSGGSTTAQNAGWTARLTTGGNDYEAAVYLTTTQIVVRDVVAGTTLATATPGGGLGTDIDILYIFERNLYLYVGYKRPYQDTWTTVWEGGATTGTATSGRHLRVGTSNASTTTHAMRFFTYMLVGSPASQTTGLFGISASSTYPEIVGRLLTGLRSPLFERSAYGRKVTYVHGKDGPGRVTDTFQAKVRASFGIDNIMWQVAPSPLRTHRSLDQSADTIVVWDVEDGSTVTSMRSPMLAFVVLNTNQRYHRFEGDPDDGGGYDTLGGTTMDLATGFTGLSWTRTGNVVTVNGGSAAVRYVWRHELVGAHIELAPGVIRRIAAHTEGVWNSANGRKVEILLATTGRAAFDGTEPSSGAAAALIHHSGIFFVPNVNTSKYKKVRWTSIGADPNPEGWEHGLVLPCAVQVVGKQWSRGWALDRDPNAEDVEVAPLSYVRKARGRAPRMWTLGWPDGIDISALRASSPSPDFLSDNAADTLGLATVNDVPFLLQGLLEELRSGEVPVVCLASIPTSVTTVTDPTLYLYGHLVSGSRAEHVVGTEGESELYRHSNWAIREIV